MGAAWGQLTVRPATYPHLMHRHPKHVWIDGDTMSSSHAPGILVDWRAVDGAWFGLVWWASGGGNLKVRAVLEWLSADRIKPRT